MVVPTANFDQDLGVLIVRQALSAPSRTILTNAGEEANVIVGTLAREYVGKDQFNWGRDASKGEYVDTVKKDIVDPLKVRCVFTRGCEYCGC